jgi:hypothetical protein
MAITKLIKHNNHQVRIHHTQGTGPHYAALRCVDCNTHIQWLDSGTTHLLASIGVDVAQGYNSKSKKSLISARRISI